MDAFVAACQSLVIADRSTSRACLRAVRAGELVHVYRHIYVRADFLSGIDQWEFARRVTLVRSAAVLVCLGPGAVLCRESAAVAHGIAMVDSVVDIHVSNTNARSKGGHVLPELCIGSQYRAHEVQVRFHRDRIFDDEVSTLALGAGQSFQIMNLQATSVQCAAGVHPRDGCVIVSGALRSLSSFDRFDLGASREREEERRKELRVLLGRRGRGRGATRARAVIQAADAGSESVGERVLVWILKAAGFDNVHTQVPHIVGGRQYFVDFELVGVDLAGEFDGRRKYGDVAQSILDAHERQSERQKDLESIGLTVVRFRYAELADPKLVIAEVVRRARFHMPPTVVPDLLPSGKAA